MSRQPKDGGPVFPSKGSFHGAPYQSDGMSLRDWFAGQWLSGLGACPDTSSSMSEVVRGCYEIADAMLAARTKGGSDE